jgi:hypothetical protein
MTLFGNKFINNMANIGGVIYVESEASFESDSDTYNYNYGNINAGAIFIATNSYFEIYRSTFIGNNATSESVL